MNGNFIKFSLGSRDLDDTVGDRFFTQMISITCNNSRNTAGLDACRLAPSLCQVAEQFIIGLLQQKITWCKIHYAGGQAHYY